MLHIAQAVVILAMTLLAGVSLCLSTWVMPIIRLSDGHTQTLQMAKTVAQGGRYLQTSSRTLSLAVLTLTVTLLNHPNAAQASQARYWGVVLCILAPLSPYEIYFIFPISDRVAEIEKRFRGLDPNRMPEKEVKELDKLITQWQWRNFGWCTPPFIASAIGFAGLLRACC